MSGLRELFGGAVVMNLPNSFVDASGMRQVPDAQEVLLDPDSNFSLILEVLQRVNVDEDVDAVKFHFDSLAHDNSALSRKIQEIIVPSVLQPESPPETPYPIILHGEQEVQKFNCVNVDRVCILIALYRIKAKGVDMVLTANTPLLMSRSLQYDEAVIPVAKAIFEVASRSLKVVNFDLFV